MQSLNLPLLRLYGAVLWGDSMVVHVNSNGAAVSQDEIEAYKAYAEEHHPGTHTLDITIDGEWVDLNFHVTPFDRIRRIA